jgi:hypothetical protein
MAAVSPAATVTPLWGGGAEVRIAVDLLDGELAIANGDVDGGLGLLAKAVAVEDGLKYDEPSDWHFPTRHLVGATLLRLGRNAEAEALFRADLLRNRENGWALAGLEAALGRQGKTKEAKLVRARLDRAWATADLGLTRLVAPPAAASTSSAGRADAGDRSLARGHRRNAPGFLGRFRPRRAAPTTPGPPRLA